MSNALHAMMNGGHHQAEARAAARQMSKLREFCAETGVLPALHSIKVLTSPDAPLGELDGDFHFTMANELLLQGNMCSSSIDKAHACGCERAFTGVETAKGTTVAIVRSAGVDAVLEQLVGSPYVASWSKLDPDFVVSAFVNVVRISGQLDEIEPDTLVRTSFSEIRPA